MPSIADDLLESILLQGLIFLNKNAKFHWNQTTYMGE